MNATPVMTPEQVKVQREWEAAQDVLFRARMQFRRGQISVEAFDQAEARYEAQCDAFHARMMAAE